MAAILETTLPIVAQIMGANTLIQCEMEENNIPCIHLQPLLVEIWENSGKTRSMLPRYLSTPNSQRHLMYINYSLTIGDNVTLKIQNWPGKPSMNTLLMVYSWRICVRIFNKLRDRGGLSEFLRTAGASMSCDHVTTAANHHPSENAHNRQYMSLICRIE